MASHRSAARYPNRSKNGSRRAGGNLARAGAQRRDRVDRRSQRRSEAIRVGLRVAGTVGLLEQGVRRALLDPHAVIHRLKASNARLSEDLLQRLERI